MRRPVLAVIAALALFALTPATLAAATPGPTPNGKIGAANMKNSHALPHMLYAMSVDNPNGNAGMTCAVKITAGVWDPGSCP